MNCCDNKEIILEKVNRLLHAYKQGLLGGEKICNYWLYVLEQYTDIEFIDRENITVAPDTHVIQASQKLGVITADQAQLSNIQIILAERWEDILRGTDLKPIDVHTPMWLWSRGRFEVDILK